MDDYITVLLEDLEHSLLTLQGSDYFLQEARATQAAEALRESLSQEQRKLFLAYEAESSALSSISSSRFARGAFLLAREIFR